MGVTEKIVLESVAMVTGGVSMFRRIQCKKGDLYAEVGVSPFPALLLITDGRDGNGCLVFDVVLLQ